jgi:hypothetical protein
MLRIGEVDQTDRTVDCRLEIAHAAQPAHHANELAALHEAIDRFVLGHHADAPVQWRVVAHRLAERRDVPVEARASPVIMRSSVVLPAPFGPSRPVMPGAMSNVTSLTATTLPNQRDTLVARGSRVRHAVHGDSRR